MRRLRDTSIVPGVVDMLRRFASQGNLGEVNLSNILRNILQNNFHINTPKYILIFQTSLDKKPFCGRRLACLERCER